jgi:hypothetical protein
VSTESKATRFTKASAFRIFKITIFGILMLNLIYYLYEDVVAHLYLAEDSTFLDLVESFAVTIDYAAWMVLIILFEIETTAHARNRFNGIRKWVISGLTAACYAGLLYAAYGYMENLIETFHFEPIEPASVCNLTTENYAYLTEAGRPIELTPENCGGFAGEAVLKSPSDKVIASQASLLAIRKLGWVDVINASAWLLVVLVFKIEISLERARKLTRNRLSFVMAAKGAAYLGLLGCAIYWTLYSAFIDSWDAWLWLIAFVLIDLNLLRLDESQNQPAGGGAVEA